MIFPFVRLKVRSSKDRGSISLFCYFAELETWNQLLPDVEEQRPSEHNPLRLELDMAFVNGASQVPLQALMEDSGFETETKPVRDEASNNSIDSPVHDAVEEQPEPSTSTSTEEVKEDPGVIARFTGGAFRQTSKLQPDGFDAFSTKKHTFLAICTKRAAVICKRGKEEFVTRCSRLRDCWHERSALDHFVQHFSILT